MTKTDIQNIIFNAIEMTNLSRNDDNQIPIFPNAQLYSKNGNVDSMGLVGLLIDIEELFLDEALEISLSDDRAMSQSQSPFRTVQTVVEYIEKLLSERTT
jgi:acyl carrier protein